MQRKTQKAVRMTRIICAGLLCFSLAACSGTASDTGTPSGGAGRSVKGQLARPGTVGLRLAAFKLQHSGQESAVTSSCPAEKGSVTIRAVPPQGHVVDGTVASDGKFSLNLDSTSTYYLLFFQGGEKCADLRHGPDSAEKGKGIIIGKGVQNVDLGTIQDVGNGVIVATQVPSFDSDLDGLSDTADTDANGDGTDDCDADYDGIKDYADDNEKAHTLGVCDVVDIFPNDGGPLYRDEEGMAVLDLTLNNMFIASGLRADMVYVVDDAGQTVIPQFTLEPFSGQSDGFSTFMGGPSTFEDFRLYTLVIPAGAITCTDGNSNPTEIKISFQPISDDYLNELLFGSFGSGGDDTDLGDESGNESDDELTESDDDDFSEGSF